MTGGAFEIPFQCTNRRMSRGRHLAYRDGAVGLPHRNACFEQHTVNRDMRPCIQEILFYLRHRLIDPAGMDRLIQRGLKPGHRMLEYAHSIFTGRQSEQIEHSPGKASDTNYLQPVFRVKKNRLIEQPHHERGWQWLQASIGRNATGASEIKNNFSIAIGQDLEARFQFPAVSSVIPKALYGIL